MRIHILGICGTFMAGIAQLAKQCGHTVTGSDHNIYPPMSTLLAQQGISLSNGFEITDLPENVDCVIVGNVIRRGNPLMEHIMNEGIPYISGPQWLFENVLRDRWVLAVAGTHGKTTTSSLLAWILEYAGLQPGFLIGGVPENFGVSARLGQSKFFVIEADEYDSAFFDKRSKFIHYLPRTLLLNNLEYDHADIFADLAAIMQQFHHMMRTVPNKGLIIANKNDQNLSELIKKGCWTPVSYFGTEEGWHAVLNNPAGSEFEIFYQGKLQGKANWNLVGNHNVSNALATIAAAQHVGVTPEVAIASLQHFKNVKRRLEVKSHANGITIYDDFAHHPTAIATTLAGLRAKIGKQRIIVVLEFGSYTMRSGVHKDNIAAALSEADLVFCKNLQSTEWNLKNTFENFSKVYEIHNDVEGLVNNLKKQLQPNDHVVVMSNSGFDGIHEKLKAAVIANRVF